jgi:hypothetical protein
LQLGVTHIDTLLKYVPGRLDLFKLAGIKLDERNQTVIRRAGELS